MNKRCGDISRDGHSLPPVLLSFSRVATQSLSWQLYRMKFKLFPVEKIYKRVGSYHRSSSDMHTFRPKVSPTNAGSISFWNWYFCSHNCRPPACSSDVSSTSPPPNPPSLASCPIPCNVGCIYCRCASSGSTATKNSENGSYSSPENSQLCKMAKNGFET